MASGAVSGADRDLALGRDREPRLVAVVHHVVDELLGRLRRRLRGDRPRRDLTERGRLVTRRALDRGHHTAVLGEEARVVLALGAGGQRVVAKTGHLVEDEGRPDDHRGLAGEVGGARRVDVLRPGHRVVLHELAVEVQRLDALGAVEGDLSLLVDHLAAVAQPDLLHGLRREGVAGDVRADEPGHLRAVERLGGGQDVVVRRRLGEAGLLEEVLAVDEQLDPRLARDGQLLVAVSGQLQRALAERGGIESLEHLGDGLGVHQLVGRERAHLAQRQTADDVGQVPGGGVGGEDLVELVLRDGGELDVHPARLRERVDDVLRRSHPVGQVLDDPDRDRVGIASTLASVPVVGGAGGEHRGEGQAGGDERGSTAGVVHRTPPGCGCDGRHTLTYRV